MHKNLTLQPSSNLTTQSEEKDTITLAGREVMIAQKPHVEADIKRAKTVLNRLLDSAPVSSVPTATLTARIIES